MPRDFLSDENGSLKIENLPGRDFLYEQPKESFGVSAALAVPRIGQDIIKGGYNFVKNIPEYYQSAKTEVPGLINTLQQQPRHALGQSLAGVGELGQGLFNLPHDIVNYISNRLNLIPENINQKIQMGRMPADTQQMISNTFGEPQYPGRTISSWLGRNSLNIIGGGAIAKTLNPMNLTSKNIVKDVLNTGEKNKKIYSNRYNNLWNEAEKKGFGDALYNVDIDIPTLKKFSPGKSIKGVVDFDKNPTLQNAHAAKSDLLRIQRDLTKLPTLRSAERQQLKAATDAINSIQSNMFKDASGKIDQNMLNKYNNIQTGYATEVIPYKNKAINKFKRNEISAKELVNSLSKGEFSAKRGEKHRAIGIRNILSSHPYVTVAGLGGLATWLLHNIMGNQPSEQ